MAPARRAAESGRTAGGPSRRISRSAPNPQGSNGRLAAARLLGRGKLWRANPRDARGMKQGRGAQGRSDGASGGSGATRARRTPARLKPPRGGGTPRAEPGEGLAPFASRGRVTDRGRAGHPEWSRRRDEEPQERRTRASAKAGGSSGEGRSGSAPRQYSEGESNLRRGSFSGLLGKVTRSRKTSKPRPARVRGMEEAPEAMGRYASEDRDSVEDDDPTRGRTRDGDGARPTGGGARVSGGADVV